jgi:cytochrome b561
MLLVGVYACIELRELFPKGSDPRNALKMWHFMLGLSVLVLVAIRVVARLLRPAPPILPDPARWQKTLAAAMHIALYALMIGMHRGLAHIEHRASRPVLRLRAAGPDREEALAERVEELTGPSVNLAIT